jgi:hypothetical protein
VGKSKTTPTSTPVHLGANFAAFADVEQLRSWAQVAVAFDVEVAFEFQPTLVEPFVLYRKWKKKWALSEPKASLPISHFLYCTNGNPRRGIE